MNKNLKFKIKNSQSAFTLIEAVVATGVFAFVVASVLGVYVSTIQLDRKTRAERAVAQNARFIMEFLAKEVRNGTINYPSYNGGLVSDTGHLYLENQANAIEHFYLTGTDLKLTKNGGASTNLNSSGVKVAALNFYIQPIGDPYTSSKTYNEQPRVTVAMELISNYGASALDTVKIGLESTFAIRAYPTRVVGGGGFPPPTPTVGIFANPDSIAYNASSTISWTSANVTSCTVSPNGWTGVSSPEPGVSTGPLTVATTYTANCSGPYGSASSSVTVTVGSAPAPDTTAPVVSAFDVQPRTASGLVTATFTATDSGGSHLKNAELWRAVYHTGNCTVSNIVGCTWSTVNTANDPTSNDDGPWSGSMTDTPPAGSSYIYGIHVNDNANNYGQEPARVKVDVTAPSFATGGTITTFGAYTIHTFTSSGTFTVNGSGTVQVLVVAGGGGGGLAGGGGGAGGVVYDASHSVTATTYSVVVGSGGSGTTSANAAGSNGNNSTFDNITAIGGGGGGTYAYDDAGLPTYINGKNGGSGGGAAPDIYQASGTVGTATSGQGHNGGLADFTNVTWPGGGGGGAGAAGVNGIGDGVSGVAGNGGAGVSNSITGSAVYYGGGGGGSQPASTTTTQGTGGSGGGGAGVYGGPGVSGTPNTGGGGGAAGGGGGYAGHWGGSGGSGIVIIRYLTP